MDLTTIVMIVIGVVFIIALIFLIVVFTKSISKLETVNDEINDVRQKMSDVEMKMKFVTDSTNEHHESIKNDLNRFAVNSQDGINKVITQASKLEHAEGSIEKLANELQTLSRTLNDKKQRGIFGEAILYDIYQNVLGSPGSIWNSQYKLSTGVQADSVLFSPTPICVDSKFPLENYNRYIDPEISEHEREAALKAFKQDVKFKISDIASKYIIPGETVNFALMFIPAESVYNEIIRTFDDIFTLSNKYHVYLCSPTNLMAYLSLILSHTTELKRNKHFETIQTDIGKLQEEFIRFETRRENIEKDITRVQNDYHDLSISAGKISKKFDSIVNYRES